MRDMENILNKFPNAKDVNLIFQGTIETQICKIG